MFQIITEDKIESELVDREMVNSRSVITAAHRPFWCGGLKGWTGSEKALTQGFEINWDHWKNDHGYRAAARWNMTRIVKQERKLAAEVECKTGALKGHELRLVRPLSPIYSILPARVGALQRLHLLYKAHQDSLRKARHSNPPVAE